MCRCTSLITFPSPLYWLISDVFVNSGSHACKQMGGILTYLPPVQISIHLTSSTGLSSYSFGNKRWKHNFCSVCGVTVGVDNGSENTKAVNLRCFEGWSEAVAKLTTTMEVWRLFTLRLPSLVSPGQNWTCGLESQFILLRYSSIRIENTSGPWSRWVLTLGIRFTQVTNKHRFLDYLAIIYPTQASLS